MLLSHCRWVPTLRARSCPPSMSAGLHQACFYASEPLCCVLVDTCLHPTRSCVGFPRVFPSQWLQFFVRLSFLSSCWYLTKQLMAAFPGEGKACKAVQSHSQCHRWAINYITLVNPQSGWLQCRHFSVGQASSHSGSSGILRIRSQCILLLSGIRCQEVPILLWSKLSRKFWARADRIYGTQTFESFSYSHLNHLSNLWDNKKSALY